MESESDKIFLTLLNKVKIYALMVLLVTRAIPSFLKKQRLLKNTLRAKGIYIVFDSDNQTKEIKIQGIKTIDFTSIRIFLKLSLNHLKSL
ncbi:hypothetical protein HpMMM27_04440 [Helicobacter pylori]